MTPFIVKSPSVQSMEPEILLFPGIITEHFCFMQAIVNDFDFVTRKGFQITDLMYDREEKNIFEYTLYNEDSSNQIGGFMMSSLNILNDEIAYARPIFADILYEDYRKGKLKGKLKEVAAELEEESNPVIMLVKYKKYKQSKL